MFYCTTMAMCLHSMCSEHVLSSTRYVLLHGNGYLSTFHVPRTCIEFYQICFTAQQWLCVYIPCAPNMYKVLPYLFYCTAMAMCLHSMCSEHVLSSTRYVLLHGNGYLSTFHVPRTCIEFYQICFTAQQWLCVYIPCAPNMYEVLPYLFYCTAMAMCLHSMCPEHV